MIQIKDKISFKEQTSLLNKCVEQGLDLSCELKKYGLTYEHLRYKQYNAETMRCSEYTDIEKLKVSSINIPAISFFSGAGGLDIGFEYAGFNNLASIEINELFCNTLRENFSDRLIVGHPDYSGDVKDREIIADILKKN
jgi:DNA (cytosine-5)-methyltransferase 1